MFRHCRRLSTLSIGKEIPLTSTRLSITQANVQTPFVRDKLNGVDVVAQGPRLPVASVGLRVPAGSCSELLEGLNDSGVSLLYQHALFAVRVLVYNTRIRPLIMYRPSILPAGVKRMGYRHELSRLLLKTVGSVTIRKSHEWPAVVEQAILETTMARASPQKMLIDLAFRAAYDRTPLGNTMWASEEQLKMASADQVRRFAESIVNYKGHSYTGVGVDPIQFSSLVETFGYTCKENILFPSIKPKKGYELYHQDTHSFEHDHVAVFWKCTRKEDGAGVDLFKRVYDTTNKVSFGERRGPLAKLHFTRITPFSEVYTDGGLFGFWITIDRSTIDFVKVLTDMRELMRIVEKGPTSEEVEYGRKALEVDRLDSYNSQYSRILGASSEQVNAEKETKMPVINPGSTCMVAIGNASRLPRLVDIL